MKKRGRKGGGEGAKEGMCGGAARTLEKAGDTHPHSTHHCTRIERHSMGQDVGVVCGKFLNGSGKKCEREAMRVKRKSQENKREREGKNNGRLGHWVKGGRRKKGQKVGSCRARRGAFSATGLVARGAETRESRVEFEREERRAFLRRGKGRGRKSAVAQL